MFVVDETLYAISGLCYISLLRQIKERNEMNLNESDLRSDVHYLMVVLNKPVK